MGLCKLVCLYAYDMCHMYMRDLVYKVCFVQFKACYPLGQSIDDAYFHLSKDKTWGYRLKPVCVVCWAHRQCIHPLAGKTRKAATFPPSLTARPTSSPWYPSAQLNDATTQLILAKIFLWSSISRLTLGSATSSSVILLVSFFNLFSGKKFQTRVFWSIRILLILFDIPHPTEFWVRKS